MASKKRINSRSKGIKWELKLLKELQEIYPEALTSRNASRKADACGCDYVNTDNFCIQVKATKTEINPHKLYEELLNRQGKPACEEKEIVIVKVYQSSQYRRQDYDVIVYLPLWLYNRLIDNIAGEYFYVVRQMKSGWRAKYFTDKFKEYTKVIAGTVNDYPEFMVAITWKDFLNLLKHGSYRDKESEITNK